MYVRATCQFEGGATFLLLTIYMRVLAGWWCVCVVCATGHPSQFKILFRYTYASIYDVWSCAHYLIDRCSRSDHPCHQIVRGEFVWSIWLCGCIAGSHGLLVSTLNWSSVMISGPVICNDPDLIEWIQSIGPPLAWPCILVEWHEPCKNANSSLACAH